MDFEWDADKDVLNQRQHGLSFEEARRLFESGDDSLEIFDAEHSESKERFQSRAGSVPLTHESKKMTKIPELTAEQLERSIPARLRARLMKGRFESGEDIAALRRFVGLTQVEFARAIEISVHTLRNWEQGRRKPEGPAIALLRIAARHPRIIRENLRSAA